jgi:hypothetical protein
MDTDISEKPAAFICYPAGVATGKKTAKLSL